MVAQAVELLIFTPHESEHFWSKVDKRDPDDCWLWTGKLTRDGYGLFAYWRDNKRFHMVTHRVAYFLEIGPIPQDMHLDHVRERGCEHRHCVNPRHLEPVTPQENNARSESPTALNARKTHCPKGHPYTGDNLRILKNGGRVCRECQNRACLARYHRRREEQS